MKPWYTTIMAYAECVPRNEPDKELYMKRTRTFRHGMLAGMAALAIMGGVFSSLLQRR